MRSRLILTSLILLVIAATLPAFAEEEVGSFPASFQTRDIATNGTTLHVRVGGSGPAVVLLHGYGEMEHVDVVAHDIGNMVGYAFVAEHRDRVRRFVLMDAPIPGIGPWDEILKSPMLWHFHFGGPDMERLVAGRERIYLDRFWNDFSADPRRFTEVDRRPGAGQPLDARHPLVLGEPPGELLHPLLVRLLAVVRPVRAAAVVRAVLDDPVAAGAEDAGPARQEPGEIAAEDLLVVLGVGELHPLTWEIERDLWHAHTLCAPVGSGD